MHTEQSFWQTMRELAESGSITLDRPRGKAHPRNPEMIYPLDYGYLENTTAADGGGIDVWIGSKGGKTLTGILCTFDKLKQDAGISPHYVGSRNKTRIFQRPSNIIHPQSNGGT